MKSTVKAYLICLLLWQVRLNAQYNTNFLNHGNTGRSVSANLDYEAGSSGLSNALVNKLVYGGFIDNETKKNSSRNLKYMNNFGVNLNYDLHAFVKGKKNVDFVIGFKNQEILNATYSRDFFNLLFYGNQPYKGKLADLSNCNINALRFQEIKFGAVLKNIDSVGKIGVALSFIKGEQLYYLRTLDNTNLYTAVDGSQLVFNSNFNMAISDTNNHKLSGFNGVGASADIYFETSYKSRLGKRSVLIVNANNIGFIHWLNNSVQFSSDSTLTFSGYQVNTINDLRDSTLNRISRDSVVNRLSNARKENFNVNIPTNLVLINKIYFGRQKFCLSFGYRYIFNANYRSYVFIEPEYKYRQFVFTAHTGYGGYSRLNVGASVMWNSPQWFVRLGSNSLQGYLFPKTSFGQGLFVSMAKKLK